MKWTKKLTSWILALAMLMSVCVFQTAGAAVDSPQVTEAGEDYLTIAWPAGYGGGVYFKLQLNGADVTDIMDGSTTYTFRNLEPDTGYNILLVPMNENFGWLSGGTGITGRTAKPETPFATVTNRTSTSIEITLSNVDEDGTYFIYSETDDGEIALAPTQFTGTVFVDENLQPGTNYHYTIYPDAGDFDDLLVSAATVPEYKIEATDVTDTTVSLAWVQKEESRSTHKLRVEAVTAGAVVPDRYRENTDVEGTSCTVTGLTPDSEYTFIVTSLKTDAGWTFMDPPYRITVKTEQSAAAYATVTNRTSSSLTVELFNADAEDTYYISAQKEDGTAVLDNAAFTGTAYVHTGLEAETTYNYIIKNADGTVDVAVSGKTMPIYKIEATKIEETSITLNWTRKENSIEQHRVKITSSTPGASIPDRYTDEYNDACLVSGTTVTVTGLTPGAAYEIKVIPMDAGWNWMDVYTIQVTTLAQVEGFEITHEGVNELSMRWLAVDGAAYFNVYQIQDGAEVLVGEQIDPVERTFRQVWLRQDTEYTYVVKAFDEDGAEIPITGFDNTVTGRTAVDTAWNNDRGEAYYTSGKLAGQNIRHETYYSELMGLEVGYNIHIPAGYDPDNTSKRYPVLYYLHALGGNENSWVSDVWGANYVETLQGMGDDMFIVYVNNAGGQWYTDAANGLYYGRSTILYELIPHIDATYNTIADKRGRALDGFSMGGVGGLLLAFERPDMFNSVVTNSAGISNSLQDFISMNWGADKTVFGRDVDAEAAEQYYAQEGIYAVYEKNKDRIEEYGLNIIMRWGEVDPVALISNQQMFELLSENPGINITNEVIPGYDHSSVYYDGGRMYQNLEFHRKNLDFTGAAAVPETKIGSINTSLGDVFIEKGADIPADVKVLIASYDAQNKMQDCQIVALSEGVRTDFTPVKDADYVKVFIWSMGTITPVGESKMELIL